MPLNVGKFKLFYGSEIMVDENLIIITQRLEFLLNKWLSITAVIVKQQEKIDNINLSFLQKKKIKINKKRMKKNSYFVSSIKSNYFHLILCTDFLIKNIQKKIRRQLTGE